MSKAGERLAAARKAADDARARDLVPPLYQAAEKLETDAKGLVARGEGTAAIKRYDEASRAYAAAKDGAVLAAGKKAEADKAASAAKAEADRRAAAAKAEADRQAAAAKAEADRKAAELAAAAKAEADRRAAELAASKAAATSTSTSTSAGAATVAKSPEHQKALDAQAAMEAAKALCAKNPRPGEPHFGWAKKAEAKGLAEIANADYVRAEKFFRDAKTFFDVAAGKR